MGGEGRGRSFDGKRRAAIPGQSDGTGGQWAAGMGVAGGGDGSRRGEGGAAALLSGDGRPKRRRREEAAAGR